MLEQLEQFTAQDTERLNQLINSNFEGATPEDIELYANWKTAVALNNAEFEMKRETMQMECAAKVEAYEKMAKNSKNALDRVIAAIENKYKVVGNGQEK